MGESIEEIESSEWVSPAEEEIESGKWVSPAEEEMQVVVLGEIQVV